MKNNKKIQFKLPVKTFILLMLLITLTLYSLRSFGVGNLREWAYYCDTGIFGHLTGGWITYLAWNGMCPGISTRLP